MKQFKTILGFELNNYLKNKVFVGVTAFLVAAMAIVMFLPRIIAFFDNNIPAEPDISYSDGVVGEDTVSTDEESDMPIMLIKPSSTEDSESLAQAFAASFGGYDVRITEDNVEVIEEKIVSGEAECAFVMDSPSSYTYYVNNLGIYDMNTSVADEIMRSTYQMSAMISGGLTPEQAEEILYMSIEGNTVSLGKDQMENYFYTYIMIFALYMVILLYGQMVATNVATEKSSRAMEVLVTSAKPAAMMFGKVFASCLAGLMQLTAVFGSALLFYTVNKSYWGENPIIASIFAMPISLLIFMLVFFILGFLIYAFLFGAIGSTASKLEDINTSVMPLTFMFVIAFIVVVFSMSSGSVDNIAMKVCSYIPFTSPMAMFTRIAMSTVPWYEIAISIVILIGSVLGIGVISAKIYRIGVLLYGTPPKLGAIIKAIRKS